MLLEAKLAMQISRRNETAAIYMSRGTMNDFLKSDYCIFNFLVGKNYFLKNDSCIIILVRMFIYAILSLEDSLKFHLSETQGYSSTFYVGMPLKSV